MNLIGRHMTAAPCSSGYDAQGKLTASENVYGDGRHTVRWCAYSYFREND
jgi:hypothetical protein